MNIQWHISQSEGRKFIQTCETVIRNVDGGTKAATTQACEEILAYSMMQCPVDTGALISTGDYIVERRGDVTGYRYQGIVGYAGESRFGMSGSSMKSYYIPGGTTKVEDVRTERGRTTYGADHGKVRRTNTRKFYKPADTDALSYGWKGARITSDRVNPKSGIPVSAYAAVVHEDLDMRHPRGGKAKFLEDPVREYGQANFARVAESHWRWAIQSVQREAYNRYGRLYTRTESGYSLVKLSKISAAPHGPRGGLTP